MDSDELLVLIVFIGFSLLGGYLVGFQKGRNYYLEKELAKTKKELCVGVQSHDQSNTKERWKMKFLLLATLMLFSVSVNAQYDDKLLHATGSYVMTNVFMEMGMTKTQAFVFTVVLGAVKESFDNNTPEEHAKDMLANVLGASGAVIIFRYKF